MTEVTCFCGKSKKNFKFLNGLTGFHAECCEEAGFNYLGVQVNKPKEKEAELLVKEMQIIEPEPLKKATKKLGKIKKNGTKAD